MNLHCFKGDQLILTYEAQTVNDVHIHINKLLAPVDVIDGVQKSEVGLTLTCFLCFKAGEMDITRASRWVRQIDPDIMKTFLNGWTLEVVSTKPASA